MIRVASEFSKDFADLSRAGAIVAQTLEVDARKRLAASYSPPWQSLVDVPSEFRDAVALAMVGIRRKR
jgi:hypothetical protein